MKGNAIILANEIKIVAMVGPNIRIRIAWRYLQNFRQFEAFSSIRLKDKSFHC